MGRQPPGSRLHCRPGRVRGRAVTPRADAHRLARRSRGASAPGVTAVRSPPPASRSRRNPEGLRPSAGTTQPRGVSPRGHGCTATPAGFGVAPQPRGLTPYGWHDPAVGRQPPGLRLDAHRCRVRGRAATPRAYAHRLAGEPAVGRQPPGLRLHGHPCRVRGRAATPRAYARRLASQPWGVSPRGHGSTATPAGFGVAPQPRGLTPIGWPVPRLTAASLSEPRDAGTLCDRSHRVPAWIAAR